MQRKRRWRPLRPEQNPSPRYAGREIQPIWLSLFRISRAPKRKAFTLEWSWSCHQIDAARHWWRNVVTHLCTYLLFFVFFFFPKPQSPWKIKCQFIITEFLYINSSRSLLYPDPYFLSLSLVAGFSSLLLLSGKKQPEGLSFWTPMTWDFNNDVTQLHLSTSILTQFWLLLILLA